MTPNSISTTNPTRSDSKAWLKKKSLNKRETGGGSQEALDDFSYYVDDPQHVSLHRPSPRATIQQDACLVHI